MNASTETTDTPRESTHHVTPADIRNIMSGSDGVDLRLVHENGKVVAMRVVGVRPGSIAARLGAQNDDIIDTINDQPMTTIEGGYRAGDAAVKSGRIVIKGKRAGVPYVTTLVIDRD